MSDELFKAKWKYSEDPEKKKGKRAHQAASMGIIGASAVGGYKMGSETGLVHQTKNRVLGSTQGMSLKNRVKDVGDSIKTASKTKGFRQGAALTGAAIVGGGLADHAAKKKDVIVRKSADHSDSPFLIEKSATPNSAVGRFLRQRSVNAHSGSIPRNSSNFKLSDKLGPARDKKKAALAPYKGGVQRTQSSLPLQARKVSARLDNR